MSFLGSLFGSGSSDNDALVAAQRAAADEAAFEERQRQNRLTLGRQAISSVFDGGWLPGTPAYGASYDPNKTYYTRQNAVWTPKQYVPTIQPGQDTATQSGLTPEQQFGVYAGGGNLFLTPGRTTPGIGEDFYTGYRDAIMGYQLPQLDDRYDDAKDQNLFNFARRGTLLSTANADSQADLAKNYTVQRGAITADAEAKAGGLRQQVAQAKQRALSLLQATEDPALSVNSALTEANALQSTTPTYTPIADVFNTAASAYQNYQDAQQRRAFANALQARSPNASAGRVIS